MRWGKPVFESTLLKKRKGLKKEDMVKVSMSLGAEYKHL